MVSDLKPENVRCGIGNFNRKMIEDPLEQSKMNFFLDLHRDPLVKELGSKQMIRDLVEKIIRYMNHANETNQFFKSEEKSLEKRVDSPKSPLGLDFSDVQQIAYCVGTYQDTRSTLKRAFSNENPLDKRLEAYAQNYKTFIENEDIKASFDSSYFEENVWRDICIAADPKRAEEVINQLENHGNGYARREEKLIRLASSADTIGKYYTKELMEVLRKRDQNLFESIEQKHLSGEDINKIAGYFVKQATINDIRTYTTYLMYFKVIGLPKPEALVIQSNNGSVIVGYKGPMQK